MRTVALYGTSLLLSGIGASLERRTGLRVLAIDAALPGAAEKLSALQPDAVVFDLEAACPDSAIALWKAQPRLLLIGVDLNADRVLVLSGQSSRVLTANDLIEVLESHTGLERSSP